MLSELAEVGTVDAGGDESLADGVAIEGKRQRRAERLDLRHESLLVAVVHHDQRLLADVEQMADLAVIPEPLLQPAAQRAAEAPLELRVRAGHGMADRDDRPRREGRPAIARDLLPLRDQEGQRSEEH